MITVQRYNRADSPTVGLTATAFYQGKTQTVKVISVKEVHGEDYVLATMVMEPVKETK